MDTDETITIEVKPRAARRILMEIGGTVYHFRVPKLYGLISTIRELQQHQSKGERGGQQEAAMFARVEDWLFGALDADEASELKQRLLDEADDVDVDSLIEAFQHLVKLASSRPSG